MDDQTTIPSNESPSVAESAEDKITFKRSHLYMALLPLAFVVGLSVGYLFWGRQSPPRAAAPQATPQAAAQEERPQAAKRYDVPVDDDPILGPENAPITLIEFSDYECPYCRRWHTEVFDRLIQEYPDQIRFVYRDFPLSSIHPEATPAAEAADCANEQGAFWQFQNLLFSSSDLSTETYIQYATDLNLDVQQFTTCIESGKYSDEVQADYQYAAELGVRSTPTFFINGLPVVGAQPYDVFKDIIDRELAGEIP
ncbi:MAG: DsbA family protein [Chloroflexota bacterium]